MPQTEWFVPLRRVVQNVLTGFDHADGQPVSESVVIQCVTAIKLLFLWNG